LAQIFILGGKGLCFCDPGQAGKSQAQHLMRALSGFTARPATESDDKLTRFGPFSSQCRAGNVKILRGSWNDELFRMLEGFPELPSSPWIRIARSLPSSR
jgi:predicted phage terminase large subunit-like protein